MLVETRSMGQFPASSECCGLRTCEKSLCSLLRSDFSTPTRSVEPSHLSWHCRPFPACSVECPLTFSDNFTTTFSVAPFPLSWHCHGFKNCMETETEPGAQTPH